MLSFKQYIQLMEVELSFDKRHPKLGELEGKLKATTTKLGADEISSLQSYGGNSHILNKTLIDCYMKGKEPPRILSTKYDGICNLTALDSATNRRFNRAFTMYSGLGFDPRKQLDKNQRIVMPAYTSGSLDKGIAGEFMKHTDENGFKHILRVNIRHNDNGLSHSHLVPDGKDAPEHEIMLPRNTVFHIHRSEIDPENPKVIVHHATIDHDTDPQDIPIPSKTNLINFLLKRIKQGTHTANDLAQAIKYGYITDKGYHEINAIANNPDLIDAHTKLANAHFDGIDIGKTVINAIANHPNSKEAHMWLALAHKDGKKIGKTAIDAIANNPDSTEAHKQLAAAHYNGKKIGKTAIDAIANNPNSTEAHNILAKAHKDGKKIGKDAINAIANNPDLIDAHTILAEAHYKGKDIGQTAIDAIANHSKSIGAHTYLALAHYGRSIGKTAIDAIANNPKSTDAIETLAEAHKNGKDVGKTAINAIANNPDLINAHTILAMAHEEGIDIGQDAIDAIVNNPESEDAHDWLADAHKAGRSIGEANYAKLLRYSN